VPAPYRVELERSPSTANVRRGHIVGVLIAIAGHRPFSLRFRRRVASESFQPPMTTWYAAMLFAVVPLAKMRLPDSPPIGFWVDVSVVLWGDRRVGCLDWGSTISCWWAGFEGQKVDERRRKVDEPAGNPSRPPPE